MKATITPSSSVCSSTMPPPITITTAIAMPVSVSTMGIITLENFDARR